MNQPIRYLLLISADEAVEPGVTSAEGMERFHVWLADLERRGILRGHEGLHPSSTATTVKVRDNHILLTDGPFMETKDQIGGFVLIECDSLDEAVEIAAGHPAARFGQVEIRPVR